MQLYVIWAAHLAAHPLFIGIFLFVGPGGDVKFAPILCMLGIVPALISAAAGRLFGREAPQLTQVIIRSALAETATLLGAVGYFEGAPLGVAAAVWLVGILAQLGNFPIQNR